MTATPRARSLSAFVDEIEALLDEEQNASAIAQGVRGRLPRLLADPSFLLPRYREPDPARYRTHVVTVAPSKRFSVVAMVWLPGQQTAIHDHVTWCVVGVLQGLEREQRFELRERGGDRWLRPLGEENVAPGETTAAVPPDENIHRVRNAGSTIAYSIHIYGADISTLGTSINECFDELPIRPDDTSGRTVAWRKVRG
jgi:predicted metal-dependent enzyme (double-stranded beta helix superfamily)